MTLYDFFAFLGATLLGVGVLYFGGAYLFKHALPSNRSMMSDRDYRNMVGPEVYEKENLDNSNLSTITRLPESEIRINPRQPDNCSSEKLRAFYKTLPERTSPTDEKLGLNGGN